MHVDHHTEFEIKKKYITNSLQIRKVLSQPKSLHPEHQNYLFICFYCFFFLEPWFLMVFDYWNKQYMLSDFIQTQDSRLI